MINRLLYASILVLCGCGAAGPSAQPARSSPPPITGLRYDVEAHGNLDFNAAGLAHDGSAVDVGKAQFLANGIQLNRNFTLQEIGGAPVDQDRNVTYMGWSSDTTADLPTHLVTTLVYRTTFDSGVTVYLDCPKLLTIPKKVDFTSGFALTWDGEAPTSEATLELVFSANPDVHVPVTVRGPGDLWVAPQPAASASRPPAGHNTSLLRWSAHGHGVASPVGLPVDTNAVCDSSSLDVEVEP